MRRHRQADVEYTVVIPSNARGMLEPIRDRVFIVRPRPPVVPSHYHVASSEHQVSYADFLTAVRVSALEQDAKSDNADRASSG